MSIDVKNAHLNGFLKDDEFAYIELPPEAHADGRCGRLRRWIYGMRPAASAWEMDYAAKLSGIGFRRGRAALTVFCCEELQVRGIAHGDDFTTAGYLTDLLLA